MLPRTRRQFLSDSLFAALTASAGCLPVAREDRLPIVPFLGEGRGAVGEIKGTGLSGRLAFDLSKLSADSLIVANDSFFIRTRYPEGGPAKKPWTVAVHGLVASTQELSAEKLDAAAQPMGAHLLECSGNTRKLAFGLLSAAEWAGVSLTEVLKKVKVRRQATRVRISGFDKHDAPARGSLAGASWVFTFAELEQAGAFLATRMNGQPLPRDHGFPVRLIMPGWYGCTCIKWVNEIVLVAEDEPATSQMQEFANRTHQRGIPRLARAYQPATIDLAALPVRVEQVKVEGKLAYRVVGILWGGQRTTNKLVIRFHPEEKYVPVESCEHKTNATWTLWTHTWQPRSPGDYRIQLAVDDPKVRTRRLDRDYYTRSVRIDSARG
jgi:DMSO/TMAO reductase YedYZ molybdopterin-dependent catalytic subunit